MGLILEGVEHLENNSLGENTKKGDKTLASIREERVLAPVRLGTIRTSRISQDKIAPPLVNTPPPILQFTRGDTFPHIPLALDLPRVLDAQVLEPAIKPDNSFYHCMTRGDQLISRIQVAHKGAYQNGASNAALSPREQLARADCALLIPQGRVPVVGLQRLGDESVGQTSTRNCTDHCPSWYRDLTHRSPQGEQGHRIPYDPTNTTHHHHLSFHTASSREYHSEAHHTNPQMKFTISPVPLLASQHPRHQLHRPFPVLAYHSERSQCDITSQLPGSQYATYADLEERQTSIDGITRLWKCETCNRAFLRKTDLIRHRHMHLGLRPHVCNECGKAFGQRSGLTVHIRTHTGERPYECGVCQKRFSDSSSMARHRRIHLRQQSSNSSGEHSRQVSQNQQVPQHQQQVS